ncbi:cobalamin-dependent protein [Sphaerisporangium aureirubrum]|uniref:Cobalamin-dependent protein n=1 Tax=Sphaerisporangium aureirubrum TaxID=1544736 RepID=A0ABW1NTC3_9ACTN
MNGPREPGGRLVILGVAESDAHAVANRLIAMRLREHGFAVVNLGVCTPLREFAEALDRHPAAEAILIGSLNGHAHEDLRDLPALRAAGRLRRPLVLGGNLSVGSHKTSAHLQRLRMLGVDHLLTDAAELIPLLDSLHAGAGPVWRMAGARRG